jgi:hypothetical protein
MARGTCSASTHPESTSDWKKKSALPTSVVDSIRKLNYTRSVRFKVLKELSRLQCDAGGATTYDGVNPHQFHRIAVDKSHQRQAWRRRWEWCTFCEDYDRA